MLPLSPPPFVRVITVCAALFLTLLAVESTPAQQVRQQWADLQQNASPAFLAGDNPRAAGVDRQGFVYTTGRVTTELGRSSIAVWKHNGAGVVQPGFPVLWPPPGSPIGGQFAGVALAVWTHGGEEVTDPRIYVIGYGPTQSSGDNDYVALCLDKNGNLLWYPALVNNQVYGFYNHFDSLDDVPVALAVDWTASNVYVTGTSRSAVTGLDIATVRFNGTTGQLMQAERYDEAYGDDIAKDIAILISGETPAEQSAELGDVTPPTNGSPFVYVAGSIYAGSSRGDDFAVLSYDADLFTDTNPGAPLHVYAYYNPVNIEDPNALPAVPGGRDIATSLSVAHKPGFFSKVYATGWSAGVGTGNDFVTVCIDARAPGCVGCGEMAWPNTGSPPIRAVRFNNPAVNGPDEAVKVVADFAVHSSEHLVQVTGRTLNASGTYDFYTIGYTSGWDTQQGGIADWQHQYSRAGVSGDDVPFNSVLGGSTAFILTGQSANGTGRDIRTLRYDADDGPIGLPPGPWWEISYPQTPSGQSHSPMSVVVVPNGASDPDWPFVVTVGRVSTFGSTQRVGMIRYEQCPTVCP